MLYIIVTLLSLGIINEIYNSYECEKLGKLRAGKQARLDSIRMYYYKLVLRKVRRDYKRGAILYVEATDSLLLFDGDRLVFASARYGDLVKNLISIKDGRYTYVGEL